MHLIRVRFFAWPSDRLSALGVLGRRWAGSEGQTRKNRDLESHPFRD